MVRLLYGSVKVERHTPDGCPQGAVLSPMLFKFVQELVIDAYKEYLKDLSRRETERFEMIKGVWTPKENSTTPMCETLLVNFADDSTVMFCGRDRKELTRCAADFLA